MSPEVEAAIIAAGVGILTLIGAIYGTHKTSQDTKDALNEQLTEQGKQLDKTFAEQRDQLDKTLRAQSDQLERTLTEQRTRTLNERFATATGQLGSDTPAVRLAGVYAMGGLADDWEENRQTCVDVLCAYLRLPYAPDPGEDAPAHKRLESRPAARSATPLSGSSPHTSSCMRSRPGRVCTSTSGGPSLMAVSSPAPTSPAT